MWTGAGFCSVLCLFRDGLGWLRSWWGDGNGWHSFGRGCGRCGGLCGGVGFDGDC